jgi:hypothetical protein
MSMAKKTVRLLILFTLGFAVFYIINSLIHYAGNVTSFPWWTCIVFAAFYFGPVLIFEGILYGILALVEKHKKK